MYFGCTPFSFYSFFFRQHIISLAAATALLTAAFFIPPTTASAADLYWSVSSGDWSTAANWGGTEPTSIDAAYVSNGGTALLSFPGETCGTLYLGGADVSTIQMSSGNLTSYTAYLGNEGSGVFNQSGGTYSVSNSYYLGAQSGANGSHILNGDGLLSASEEYVGYYGVGSFQQSAGRNNLSSSLYVGTYNGSNGSYALSGSGRLSAYNEYVGYYGGNGSFSQSGGTNAITYSLYLGYSYSSYTSPSVSNYSLDGDGLLTAPYEYIGSTGNYGYFKQSGGTNSTAMLILGNLSSGTGSYVLEGSGLLNVGEEYIGYYQGAGRFNQSGGTHNVTGNLHIGYSTYSRGAYTLADTGILNVSGALTVGELDGTGTLEWFNDGLTAASMSLGYKSELAIGFDFNVASLLDGSLYHGSAISGLSTAVLSIEKGAAATQSSSTSVNYGGLLLGRDGTTASYSQFGGTTSAIYLGVFRYGQYVLAGSSLAITDGLKIEGTLDCAGGSNSISVTGSAIVDFSRGNVTNTGATSLDVAAGSLVIVSSDFDPASAFGSYSNAGITHVAGTTLTLAKGQSIGGIGDINDFVVCGGTINASTHGSINLENGLSLSAGGYVYLNGGELTCQDSVSGMTGGTLNAGLHYVGYNGIGSFTQSNGSSTVSSALYVGYRNGSSGRYVLRGTSSLYSPEEYVGYSNVGVFNHSNGLNTATSLYLGYYTDSSGTYNLTGNGRLSTSNLYLGDAGTGEFNQSGGINDATSLYLGYNYGSTGTYNLSGSASLNSSFVCIGYDGTGIVRQTGGVHTVQSSLYLGGYYYYSGNEARPNAVGKYYLSENALLTATEEIIGNGGGTGTFTQTGGTNIASYTLFVGCDGYSFGPTTYISHGTYNLNGGYLSSLYEYVGGSYGTGVFNQFGGINTANQLIINTFSSMDTEAAYTLSGSGYLSVRNLYVGPSGGVGTFHQTGGTAVVLGTLEIGCSGLTSVTPASYNFEGGLLKLHSLTVYGNAKFYFGGGTLRATSNFASSAYLTLTGIGGDATLDTAGCFVAISGDVSGAGGLQKNGMGTLALAGNNTYLGATTVSAGILQLSGESHLGGVLSVADGAAVIFGTPCEPDFAPEIMTTCALNASTSIQNSSSSEIAPVPEPATLVLLAASILLAVTIRLRRKA